MRQAGSSDQKAYNYDNQENHIFCTLEFVMLKFTSMMHLKNLALIKK